MGTTYLVEIDLQTKGDLHSQLGQSATQAGKADQKIGDLTRKVGDLGASASAMGGKLTDAFTGAVEKVGALTAGLAMLGAGAAAGAAVYGIGKLNNELEGTGISLAAMFGAQGLTRDLNEGLAMASDTLRDMRKDAAALPGEFSDLKSIFKDVAIPGFGAGANVSQLRELASKTMAFGAVAGLPMEQVGREMAMLLEGRAGAHNVLGMRLAGLGGDQAQTFNAASPEARLETLTKALDKYAPAVEAYKHSFDGLFSTGIDNAKHFVQLASAPMFERAKLDLERIDNWFDKNETKVAAWAGKFGDRLGDAWDFAESRIEAWWPAIEAFTEHAYARLAGIWTEIQPYVERFGETMHKALEDPGTLDRIESVLKLYAAAKIGHGAFGLVGGPAMSLAKLGGSMLGGEGTAGIGGAGGLASVGELSAALGPLALAAAAAGVSVAGAAHAFEDETSAMHDTVVTNVSDLKDTVGRIWGDMTEIVSADVELLSPAVTELADLMGTGMTYGLRAAATAAENFLGPLAAIAHLMRKVTGKLDEDTYEPSKHELPSYGTMQALTGLAAREQEKRSTTSHPGGHNTNIAKVEIVVTTNQDPSRVARVIEDHLVNLKRHPRASRNVPNYSAPR